MQNKARIDIPAHQQLHAPCNSPAAHTGIVRSSRRNHGRDHDRDPARMTVQAAMPESVPSAPGRPRVACVGQVSACCRELNRSQNISQPVICTGDRQPLKDDEKAESPFDTFPENTSATSIYSCKGIKPMLLQSPENNSQLTVFLLE